MAHSEKETYESYPRDAFDNPPIGPVGVHRGRRSLVVRIAPFIIVIVVAALAGLLVWGLASGELKNLVTGKQTTTSQSVSKDQADGADASDDQSNTNNQDESDDQSATDDQSAADSSDQTSGNDQTQNDDATSEEQPETQQTVNYATSIRIVNASGVNGYAGQQASMLQSLGYSSVVASNPSGGTLPSTNVVWYQNETDLATAQNVAAALGITNVEQATDIADPVTVVYIYVQ